MDSETRLERLIETGVLMEASGENTLKLTDAFERAVDNYRTSLEQGDTDFSSMPFEVTCIGKRWLDHVIPCSSGEEVDLASISLALFEFEDTLPSEEVVPTVTAISQLRSTHGSYGGVPENFLPVNGYHLHVLLKFYRRAIVYVWRENCDPCDLMRADFDELFVEPPGDVALFAVYGPAYAEHLLEKYHVGGAPTTLFVFEGQIDSRLVGPHYRTAIESELEVLRGH